MGLPESSIEQINTAFHLESEYERRLASLLRVKYAIAFGYARTALAAILTALGLRPGDAVLLSPLTCKVVPLTLLSLNLRPVYVDISDETLNLDPAELKTAAQNQGNAILFQHTYGLPAGIEKAGWIAHDRRIPLVEDCAQCLPRRVDPKGPGGCGCAAIFSNNLLKPLPAGSGGVAVTNDDELAAEIGAFRKGLDRPGRSLAILQRVETTIHRFLLKPKYYWTFFDLSRSVSPNYKTRAVGVEIQNEVLNKASQVNDYQISEGLKWLDAVESIAAHRRNCCAEYRNALNTSKTLTVPATDAALPLYYFPVFVNNKVQLIAKARKYRIEITPWPLNAPIYPFERCDDLRDYGYSPGSCPAAERVAKNLIGLPTHPKITQAERRRIIDFLLA